MASMSLLGATGGHMASLSLLGAAGGHMVSVNLLGAAGGRHTPDWTFTLLTGIT